MSDKDGITGDVRSREEEYFRRKDRELVEKMRQAAESHASRQAMEQTTGIRDPALLQELEALGFTPDTVSLLPLVPIVQVAWAEGGVSENERKLIVEFARGRNIPEGSPADQQLSTWLEQRPSEDVFARATRLIRAMLDRPGAEPGAWSVTGPPAGSPAVLKDWARTGALFQTYGAVTTDDTVLLGFGLEHVTAPADRAALIGKALSSLEN